MRTDDALNILCAVGSRCKNKIVCGNALLTHKMAHCRIYAHFVSFHFCFPNFRSRILCAFEECWPLDIPNWWFWHLSLGLRMQSNRSHIWSIETRSDEKTEQALLHWSASQLEHSQRANCVAADYTTLVTAGNDNSSVAQVNMHPADLWSIMGTTVDVDLANRLNIIACRQPAWYQNSTFSLRFIFFRTHHRAFSLIWTGCQAKFARNKRSARWNRFQFLALTWIRASFNFVVLASSSLQ